MPDARRRSTPPPRGRGFGYLVFGLLVGGITAAFSIQILIQVFAPKVADASPDCPAAMTDLSRSLERARQSAVEQPDETAAVSAFRGQLLPEWEQWSSIQHWCGRQPQWAAAVAALGRARFAEEQGVRFGARELFRARERALKEAERARAGIGEIEDRRD